VEYTKEIDKVKWYQFIVAIQWEKIRGYCSEKNVRLIGDMPFYVSYDSVDVWANAYLFNLDDEGKPTGVAGVPPDYFSEDGQLWGMPTFKWDVMKQDKYAWWVARLRKHFELFDLVRLDHFRAFETYWEVPPTDTTARNGRWIPGPGMDFFDSVRRELGGLPLIAEDLGYEMEQVYKLRDKTGLPGMKVLQFAWGENLPVSVDIPHNYTKNCVVYTGTHDNNTTIGWYKHETHKPDHKRMKEYLGSDVDEGNVHKVMGRLAYASVADTVILPIQDVLGLDERDRMNTPGTIKDNWMWRLPEDALTEDVEKQLMEWATLFKRR
jgi:4-alpha-glucanotransferase